MNDDPRGRIYCDEYAQRIQEQLEKIALFIDTERNLTSAEDLETLEEEVQQLTSVLGGLLVGDQLQRSLCSEKLHEEESALVRDYPKRLNSDGLVKVVIRTAQGLKCEVQARYYRQKGGRRGRGLYPGLLVLGIHDRCTPGLASEVSQLSAILGSLEEARGVLSSRGVELNIKVISNKKYTIWLVCLPPCCVATAVA